MADSPIAREHPPQPVGDAPERLLALARDFVAETHPGRSLPVTLDSRLERDLGLDSLSRVELLLRVAEIFGRTLPETAVGEVEQLGDILGYLGAAPAIPTTPAVPVTPAPADGEVVVPEHATTLVEVLEWHAARVPGRRHVLLLGEGGTAEEISYGALLEAARGVATGLIARGLRPGQTVALMLPTGRDYLACFMGAMLAGGVPVPIYPPARMKQVEEHLRRHAGILANAGAAFLVTVPQARAFGWLLGAGRGGQCAILTPDELAVQPQPVAHRPKADDLAFLQYTSGSTGDPKGVMLTHANLLANLRAMGATVGAGAADTFVSWLPLYHDMGLIGAWFAPLYFGFPLVLMSPLAFLARPARWLQAISRHGGTLSAAPNFAFDLCVRKIRDEELEGVDLSSWRYALNGAEPVSPATLESFAARFARWGLKREALNPAYGLAECSVGLTFPPLGRGPRLDIIDAGVLAERGVAEPAGHEEHALRLPGCGFPIPGHDLRILGEDGRALPERRVGRIEFRGPSATAGYFRNPQATARLLHEGWLDTGDTGYLADGELFVTGRVKDVIIRGGRNIYPYELEQAVGELPDVRRGCVAVFGVADGVGATERLVVLAETRETDEGKRERLRTLINDAAVDVVGMAADEVVLAPPYTVLKTSSGKIRRAASREVYLRGEVGAALPPVWRQMLRLALPVARARLDQWRRRAGPWLYGAWAWLALVVLGLPVAAAIIALGQSPRAQPGLRRLAHLGARAWLAAVALPVQARGVDRLPARGHMLVVNHASYLDAVILFALLPPRAAHVFAAKAEFAAGWITRRFFSGLGGLFVERTEARRGADDVATATHLLRCGHSMAVFPEGTFGPEAGLREFRMGAFVAAARAGVPVVPAALTGTREALRDGTWWLRRHPVCFTVGDVLIPSGDDWSEAARLREAARAAVLGMCGEEAGVPAH